MRSGATAVFCALLASVALVGPLHAQDESPAGKLLFALPDGNSLMVEGAVRPYYRNDQRIAWSGVEETYGVEAALRPLYTIRDGDWTFRARGEFFLNEANGSPLLRDPVRDLYRGRVLVPPFQIQQLALEAERGDWLVRFGRIATPLGRSDVPTFSNQFLDTPFLRTEIVGFAETGLFVRWHPGPWSLEAGLSNGGDQLDTNSSKALIARVGIDRPRWSAGVWIKAQDGIGSEELKRFNSFVGFDACVRAGRWTFYAEGLVDEHGMYRDPALLADPTVLDDRSLYGRDVFRAFRTPSRGGGFDLGATCRAGRFLVDYNFGAYFPERIGMAVHDAPVYRGTVKWAWEFTPHFQAYVVTIAENTRPQPFLALRNYSPKSLLFGVQFGF